VLEGSYAEMSERDPLSVLARVEADELYDHDVVSEAAHARASERGGRHFADLLFALTHVRVAPERAHGVWTDLLEHRDALSMALGRRVGITTAAVDLFEREGWIDRPPVAAREWPNPRREAEPIRSLFE